MSDRVITALAGLLVLALIAASTMAYLQRVELDEQRARVEALEAEVAELRAENAELATDLDAAERAAQESSDPPAGLGGLLEEWLGGDWFGNEGADGSGDAGFDGRELLERFSRELDFGASGAPDDPVPEDPGVEALPPAS